MPDNKVLDKDVDAVVNYLDLAFRNTPSATDALLPDLISDTSKWIPSDVVAAAIVKLKVRSAAPKEKIRLKLLVVNRYDSQHILVFFEDEFKSPKFREIVDKHYLDDYLEDYSINKETLSSLELFTKTIVDKVNRISSTVPNISPLTLDYCASAIVDRITGNLLKYSYGVVHHNVVKKEVL
ncbi:MAG: hypothetical protein IBX57_00475 [Gammaproteobacteria bacterium]|nr:hypothetical protein [Gammaproteobacteria bacterium]